jgi:hypothetical protein
MYLEKIGNIQSNYVLSSEKKKTKKNLCRKQGFFFSKFLK